jgi:hypothetical protein
MGPIHARWVGLLVVGLVGWTLTRWLGLGLGLLLTSPVIGFWVAYWAGDGWRTGVWWSRWLRWRGKNGHHHVFHNQPVTLRKLGGRVWIRLADIQAIVGEPASEVARRRLVVALGATRFHCKGKADWWLREDALLEWLERVATVQNRQAGRLHHWLANEALRSAHATGLMTLPSL